MGDFHVDSLSKLQSLVKDSSLSLVLRSDWGSDTPNHRTEIRLALQQRPESMHSVSHTQGLGGFAVSSKNQLGFDIEVIARVTDKIIARICPDPSETLESPSAAHLWVAKEASFKALKGPHQPQLLSQIRIGQWISVPPSFGFSQIETFRIQSPQISTIHESIGITFQKDQFIFALFSHA